MTGRALAACGVAALLGLAGCAGGGGPRPRPAPERSAYLQRIEDDLRAAGAAFTGGHLTGKQYLALSVDRAGKARRWRDDAPWREAAARGDGDGDAVPDRYDDCTTGHLEPTDERGCPLPAPPDCDRDPRCAGPSPEDDHRTRDLLDRVTLLFNPACDGSPMPETPEPIEWGRAIHAGGFLLAVTKVSNQEPGCEFFYELQLRSEWQPAGGPLQVRFSNVLFRAAEDRTPGAPRRALFHLPGEVPLPLERQRLREAFEQIPTVSWRVRAVNGANLASPWSAPRQQGPAPGGVRE